MTLTQFAIQISWATYKQMHQIREHQNPTAKLEHVVGAFSAEVAALTEGLKLALSIGGCSIAVHMENLIVVDALNLNVGH